MYLSNKMYDIVKWIAQFFLPGLATLYFALSGIWNLPFPEEIVGTIVAVDVFLGVLLGLSNMQYKQFKYFQAILLGGSNPDPFNSFNATDPSTAPPTFYEVTKWVTLIFLPASGALYFALSEIWKFPYGQEVVGTIAAITAFMGFLLGIGSSKLKALNPQT